MFQNLCCCLVVSLFAIFPCINQPSYLFMQRNLSIHWCFRSKSMSAWNIWSFPKCWLSFAKSEIQVPLLSPLVGHFEGLFKHFVFSSYSVLTTVMCRRNTKSWVWQRRNGGLERLKNLSTAPGIVGGGAWVHMQTQPTAQLCWSHYGPLECCPCCCPPWLLP